MTSVVNPKALHTPYSTKNRPYGVLHVASNSDHMVYSSKLFVDLCPEFQNDKT